MQEDSGTVMQSEYHRPTGAQVAAGHSARKSGGRQASKGGVRVVCAQGRRFLKRETSDLRGSFKDFEKIDGSGNLSALRAAICREHKGRIGFQHEGVFRKLCKHLANAFGSRISQRRTETELKTHGEGLSCLFVGARKRVQYAGNLRMFQKR